MEENINTNLNLYIPITKIDQERREVWGWAAIEQPDQSQEIMDYQSSKPHFENWTNLAQKRSGGKSKGNVREMHQASAAGKLIELRADDANKGFYVGAKIVDDDAWRKVEEGVYTGFSVGGSYVRRWPDQGTPGLVRYTAKPGELSIVDSPCIPDATFQMVKIASVEAIPFKPGNSGVKIAVVWGAEDTDLEKGAVQTPAASPQAVTPAMPVKPVEAPGEADLSVATMPAMQETLVIASNEEVPAQSELMRAANLFQEEMEDQISEMLGKIPEMVKTVIREQLALEMAKFQKATTSVPAERMIRVVKH
jgi:hypothetical protein